MLYVGVFQIGWLGRLACPGFGSGCESVALASFSFPLGLADGLLAAALAGLIAAAAQIAGREAAAVLVVLGFANLLAYLIALLEMQKFGAWCLWCLLAALLALPIAVLAHNCARASERRSDAARAAVAPDDQAEKGQ